MTHRIHVLPEHVANVIAAGEVVERPASVVKELIENALDAGATDISVRLENAGKDLIEVADNGSGMSAAEAALALERHATSKVHTLEDLTAIATLGFRGEALPSIAAASTLTLTTRLDGDDQGHQIHAEWGAKPYRQSTIGAPVGTSITIRQLFAKLPARRKFLKGDKTELSHIQDIVTRQALAAPHCRFRLIHNDRTLMQCTHTMSPGDRLLELFGTRYADKLLPVDERGTVVMHGYCGSPDLARAGSSQLYLFINGRAVRDRVLTHAVFEGYRTHIPHGEQPFATLYLEMSPDLVDVNVHPAKAEVRFSNSGAIHEFVKHAVRKTIERASPVAGRQSSVTPYNMPHDVQQARGSAPLMVQEAIALYQPVHSGDTPYETSEDGRRTTGDAFRPLGQLAGTYLLYETPEQGLLIIDQHAAHERVGYEELKASLARQGIQQQTLLDPLIIELTSREMASMIEHADVVQQIGLDLEPFGEREMAVKAVPTILGDCDLPKLIHEIAADLGDHGRTEAVEKRLDHLLATMACHRQLRAGDSVGHMKALGLLDQMQAGPSTARCPHGRPTWVYYPKLDIEKWFKRA